MVFIEAPLEKNNFTPCFLIRCFYACKGGGDTGNQKKLNKKNEMRDKGSTVIYGDDYLFY